MSGYVCWWLGYADRPKRIPFAADAEAAARAFVRAATASKLLGGVEQVVVADAHGSSITVFDVSDWAARVERAVG